VFGDPDAGIVAWEGAILDKCRAARLDYTRSGGKQLLDSASRWLDRQRGRDATARAVIAAHQRRV